MATNSKREVELVIGVETSGQQSVKALSDAVSNLAKEGGEAAPEFQKLARELDRVAEQQTAIETFAELRRQTVAVSGDLAEASAAVDRLGNALPEAANATELFVRAQQEAKASLDANKALLREAQDALKALNAEYDRAGKKTDEYRIAAGELGATIKTLKVNNAELRQEYAAAQVAATGAAREQKELSTSYNQSLNSARELSAELGRNNAALERSRDTLRSVGVESTNLSTAQQEVRQSFAAIRAETERQATALEKAEAATRALAAAERLLQSELEIESASKREAIALEEQRTRAVQESAQALRRSAAESAAAIETAFAKTGAKSAQTLEREINDINESLNRLAFNARVSGADFDKAFASGQERIRKLRAEVAGVPDEINKAGAATGYLRQQFSQLAAIYGGIELGRAFIDANVQLETMRRSLAVITGSTQTAATQIDFLRNTANKAGVSIAGISDAFIRFNASATTAGISTQVVNDVFSSVTLAGGKLGLSTERVALSLEALGQIASKGVVSMEELRGQLGDSFPGALSVASKALGVTQGELVKLVENGQVLAEDFLPAFGKAIEREFGGASAQVTGFAATWAQLKNVMNQAFTTIGDTGAMDALGNSLRVVGAAAGTMALGVSAALDAVILSVRSVAEVVAGIAEGDIKGAFKRIGDLTEQAVARQAKFATTLQNLVGVGTDVAETQNTAATAIAATGAAAQSAAAGHSTNAVAQQQTAVAAGQNAAAQASAGSAATASGQQAAAAGQSWYQLTVRYNEAKVASENATQASIRQAEADKIRGDTMVRVAQLSRDEVRVMTEASAAADAYARSSNNVALARQAEATVVQNQLAALNAEIAKRGEASSGQTKQLAELTQLLEKKTAEAAKSLESAAAARQEAVERDIAAKSYRDNADAVGTLRQAAEAAQVALAAMVASEREGLATSQEVTAARVEEAKAMALYGDAIQDLAARSAALVEVRKAEVSQTQANLSVDLARAKASESFARTYQNEGLQRAAQIDQRRIEIKMIEATRQAIIGEQQALIAKARADQEELRRTGQLTETKRLEIEARIKAAQAKLTEAEGGKGKIAEIENEITALLRQAETQRSVSNSNISSIQGEIQTRKQNADAIATEAASSSARSTTMTGTGMVDNSAQFRVKEKLAAGTLTDADSAEVKAVYEAARANYNTMQQAAIGTFSFAGQKSIEGMYRNAQQAYDKVFNKKGLGADTEGTGGPVANSSSRTVNINLNGSTTSVKVQSDADARNMEALLTQLSTGARTAN